MLLLLLLLLLLALLLLGVHPALKTAMCFSALPVSSAGARCSLQGLHLPWEELLLQALLRASG
jgi:hypothetical protein